METFPVIDSSISLPLLKYLTDFADYPYFGSFLEEVSDVAGHLNKGKMRGMTSIPGGCR